MTQAEWDLLQQGDVIKSKKSTLRFIVTGRQGKRLMVSRAVMATNPEAWELVPAIWKEKDPADG